MRLLPFLIIIVCIGLSGCRAKTLQEEKMSMTYMNPVELCVQTSVKGDSFTGWQTNRAAAARQLINQRGIECDWAAVEMLKQQKRAAAMANTPYIMQLLEQGQWKTYDGQPLNAAPTPQSGGFLRSSTVSGQMRYCNYNKMGSTVVITIKKHQICPLTN